MSINKKPLTSTTITANTNSVTKSSTSTTTSKQTLLAVNNNNQRSKSQQGLAPAIISSTAAQKQQLQYSSVTNKQQTLLNNKQPKQQGSKIAATASAKSKLADLDDFADPLPAPTPIKPSKLAELDEFSTETTTKAAATSTTLLLQKLIPIASECYARVLGRNHANMRALRELTGCAVEPQDRERAILVRHVSSSAHLAQAVELVQMLVESCASADSAVVDLRSLLAKNNSSNNSNSNNYSASSNKPRNFAEAVAAKKQQQQQQHQINNNYNRNITFSSNNTQQQQQQHQLQQQRRRNSVSPTSSSSSSTNFSNKPVLNKRVATAASKEPARLVTTPNPSPSPNYTHNTVMATRNSQTPPKSVTPNAPALNASNEFASAASDPGPVSSLPVTSPSFIGPPPTQSPAQQLGTVSASASPTSSPAAVTAAAAKTTTNLVLIEEKKPSVSAISKPIGYERHEKQHNQQHIQSGVVLGSLAPITGQLMSLNLGGGGGGSGGGGASAADVGEAVVGSFSCK